MNGSISFNGSLIGDITGGGGGSGDEVIITPLVTSGTKIADVSVNGVEKDLYCPNPTQVNVTQVQQSGTKLASIDVNGVNSDIYAPDSNGHEYSTSEHVVGVWVDGRPVYEKTMFVNAPSGAGTFDIVTLDSNIDLIVSQSAFLFLSSYIRFLPHTYIGNNDTNIYFNLPTLKLVIDSDNWEGYQICITLQYTKSTDTPI